MHIIGFATTNAALYKSSAGASKILSCAVAFDISETVTHKLYHCCCCVLITSCDAITAQVPRTTSLHLLPCTPMMLGLV